MARKVFKRLRKLRELEESGEINTFDSIEEVAEKLGMRYVPPPEVRVQQKRHERLQKEFKRIYNGVSIYYGFPYRIK